VRVPDAQRATTTRPPQPARVCAPGLAPVPVGQVGTFSGVLGTITASARAALSLWATDLNARGGLACHPVRIYSEDDAGDPARAAAAVDSLAQAHHVAAFVGDIVPLSVGGFRPQIEKTQIPAVGGDLLTPEWNTSPWMFPQGGGLDDQITGILRAGGLEGKTRFGLLYCVEIASCTYVGKHMPPGTRSGGLQVVYTSPVSVTQPDFTAQCLNAKNAGVDVLGLAIDGASMTRVARSCAAVGYRPLLAVGAGTFNLETTKDENLRRFGMLSVSSVAPWTAQDRPGLQDLHRAIDRLNPQLAPDGEVVLAWAAGRLLEAAIAALTPSEQSTAITAQLITTGLGRISNNTLDGLTGPLTFAPGRAHPANGCVYFSQLGETGWWAPHGSRPDCATRSPQRPEVPR